MRADLHSKVDFVLRLYADIAGVLTPEAKSSLLKDFVTSVEEVLQFADSIPGSVLASVEKAFWSDEPGKLMTVLELYDVCLTNPQISGMLHEFSASQRQEKLRQRDNGIQNQHSAMRHGDNNSTRIKSIARSMSSATLPCSSLLWDLKAGDYGNFWLQPDLLQIPSNETCAQALERMAQAGTQSALVVEFTGTAQAETTQSLGLISTDKLLLYFLRFLVPGFEAPTAKSRSQLQFID
ncbi:CBS domain [Phytophthora cinnamomi]|uniref:CBS domain n=1 Tax=Phytophthora cinnamomi TaxID=4785 RepID=UPI003559B00B|nr:CBS domain [Phytophthora cinnamomi]